MIHQNRRGETMKNAGKGGKSSPRSGQDVRKDRKSGTGMIGSPKKGGRGGKYTWDGVGYSEAELGLRHEAVDAKDPNFEDPQEEKINVDA